MIFLLKNNLFISSLMFMIFILFSKDFFVKDSFMFIFNFYLFNSMNFSFPILLDFYSVLFSMTVLFISSNIMKFSTFYMSDETYKTRFLLILLLFIFSMIFLIFVPNLFFLMIGWDGLGMSSFYLIMYYHNQKSLGASMLTMLSNRVGDLCLLLSIALLFSLGMSFFYVSSAMVFFLTIGCFTKSAQFPFMSWLPAAMAAPTPVSALVHSSTLVTAGVYLMIRFSFIIMNNPASAFIIALISSLTMFISAVSAMFETDFKKIIALSTLSQLGFMMFSLSQMLKMCSFFHLITHAIFKSLLFICAGVVIILSGHNQDIRSLPKLSKSITQSCFIVASMALMSSPFMVGFYSKDLILEMFLHSQTESWILVIVLCISSWLTVAYSVRMMYLAMWQSPNFKFASVFNFKEVKALNKAMTFSALGSIFLGSALSWLFSFETKFFLPSILSSEMNFICLFILFGVTTFFFLKKINSSRPLLYLLFLTPLFQKSSELTFNFSKNLYHFSDLAWLEKSTFEEPTLGSMKFSSSLFTSMSKKPLMKQMIVICLVLLLIKCL